ncbi:MAG: antA/AntB antirepressor family protein [Lachnospiraceae bacterium]
MNEIQSHISQTPIEIALGIDVDGKTTARKLYEFLELAKGQFSRWAKTNITENPFAENGVDYEGFDIDVEVYN